MAQCNTLSINIQGLWDAIKAACRSLLDDVAERVIQEFGPLIYQDGAGRHEWRANAAQEFQKIEEDFSGEVFQVKLGLRPGLEAEAWGNVFAAQIMVALFGNHPPIETKPGLEVFKDHMLSRGTSDAQSVYPLPQFSWTDPNAQKMVETAIKITRPYFKDGINSLLDGINFADYVIVS